MLLATAIAAEPENMQLSAWLKHLIIGERHFHIFIITIMEVCSLYSLSGCSQLTCTSDVDVDDVGDQRQLSEFQLNVRGTQYSPIRNFWMKTNFNVQSKGIIWRICIFILNSARKPPRRAREIFQLTRFWSPNNIIIDEYWYWNPVSLFP